MPLIQLSTLNRDEARLAAVLAQFPFLRLAMLFGSVSRGAQRVDSDLDIAVSAEQALTANERIQIVEALAQHAGRPVDLIDLKTVGEPLLGQILRHGRKLLGSSTALAQLISRHLLDEADFMPYQRRILAERRAAWIGK